jgi:hypothetical protein
MSTCKLFTGKAQKLSRTSRVSTRALAVVSLQQEKKRNVILTNSLVCVIDGVLVMTA